MAAKNYTRAAKRRAKKAQMPELAQAPRKHKDGRKKRKAGHVADSNPCLTVLEARARHMGKAGRAGEMKHPALSEAAGQAIFATLGAEAAEKAWEAYAGLTAAEASYHRYYTGLRLNAKTAKIEMAPERFEARADDRPDLRSEEDRARDAVNRWMRWRGLVMHLPSHQQEAIFDAAYGRCPQMDGGKPTGAGERLAWACDALAKVVEKQA